jgi:hypothetical protein
MILGGYEAAGWRKTENYGIETKTIRKQVLAPCWRLTNGSGIAVSTRSKDLRRVLLAESNVFWDPETSRIVVVGIRKESPVIGNYLQGHEAQETVVKLNASY